MENISAVVQPERLRAQIEELSQQAAAPDLWDDPSHAQEVTSQLSHRQSELDRVLAMEERIDDLEAIVDMARETAESDPSEAEDIFAEAEADLGALKDDMSALEIRTLLDGEYDERNAVITIRSGAGGVDAAVLTAPSTTRAVLELLGSPSPVTRLVAIGATTAAAAHELGLPVAATASSPTPEGVLRAVIDASQASTGSGSPSPEPP